MREETVDAGDDGADEKGCVVEDSVDGAEMWMVVEDVE